MATDATFDAVPAPLDHQGDSLGIRRGNYIAVGAPDAEKAAKFAEDVMGFSTVHVDDDGAHYLAAHGPDPYSLVYVPGGPTVVRISYVISESADLGTIAAELNKRGVETTTSDGSHTWKGNESLSFEAFNGTQIELTTGVNFAIPVSEALPVPDAPAPAPLAFDHAILKVEDMAVAGQFATETLGWKESGKIVAPDGPFLAFYRGSQLFHCFGLAHSTNGQMHHYQFTLKNDRAVIEAHRAIVEGGVAEVLWGPLRHGCGQNIAFYFRDQIGNIVEYSSEEELILDDDVYETLHWPVQNHRATDEWGSEVPDAIKQ
jgi:catechol 2,3-dioxygenase